MHGLISRQDGRCRCEEDRRREEVTGIIHAGDFGGHWLSKTDLAFTIRLTAEAWKPPSRPGMWAARMSPSHRLHPTSIFLRRPHPGQDSNSGSNVPRWTTMTMSSRPARYCPSTRPSSICAEADSAREELLRRQLEQHRVEGRRGHREGHRSGSALRVAIEGLSPEIKTIQMYAPPTANFVPSSTSTTWPIRSARSGARRTPTWLP